MTITPIQNYTDKELNFNFSSPENDYTFNFLDIIEPNNGRLLREIKVTFKVPTLQKIYMEVGITLT